MERTNKLKELERLTAPLFKGKMPLNSSLVQMMINDRIAQRELAAAKEYYDARSSRKAYFFEKLANLTHRTIFHIGKLMQDRKNRTFKEQLLTLQKELFILTNAKPDWTTSELDQNTLMQLLSEY